MIQFDGWCDLVLITEYKRIAKKTNNFKIEFDGLKFKKNDAKNVKMLKDYMNLLKYSIRLIQELRKRGYTLNEIMMLEWAD